MEVPVATEQSVSKSNSSEDDSSTTSRSDFKSISLVNYDMLNSASSAISDIEKLLEFHRSESFAEAHLALREYVVFHGIHGEGTSPPSDSLRSKVWKVLLGVSSYFEVDPYLMKSEEPNSFDAKIMDDVFRTFRGNEEFWRKVDANTMTRILRATAVEFGYVQGMNVLLAPFLYIMPELDSFYCFHALVSDHLTSYCNKNLLGVHKGVQLVNRCLQHLDAELYRHIMSKIPDMTILSVRFLMTLMANVQPLTEVLSLWDRIFAIGVHSTVLVFCAHLIRIRASILQQSTGYKISTLIEQSTLDANALIQITLSSLPQIPPDLMEELLLHTTAIYSPLSSSSS